MDTFHASTIAPDEWAVMSPQSIIKKKQRYGPKDAIREIRENTILRLSVIRLVLPGDSGKTVQAGNSSPVMIGDRLPLSREDPACPARNP
jgi:hypothetical protein